MLLFVFSTMMGCNLFGGGGVCNTLADASESCGESEPTDEELDECEESVESCSSSDENALVRYVECAFFCEEGTGADTGTTTGLTGLGGAVACAAELEDVSEECLAAIGFSTATTTFTY